LDGAKSDTTVDINNYGDLDGADNTTANNVDFTGELTMGDIEPTEE
jgi:hypothetical protein